MPATSTSWWFAACCVTLLCACDRGAHGVMGDRPRPAVPAAPGDDPPPEGAPVDSGGQVGFSGFGTALFGEGPQRVREAWGEELGTPAPPAGAGGCHYLVPRTPTVDGYRIAFMIEQERFVRIDVRTPDVDAPGGGRVGMTAAEIAALYAGAESSPHKYVDGARVLRVADPDGGQGVLVFETGADGRVDRWRAGVAPQIDYVEACG